MISPIRYGLIGCGGFGRFCLGEYRRMLSVECVAVADANSFLAEKTALEHHLACCESAEALIDRADIDLVHLATPPSTHAPLALAALRAGKHVLCEKPLALDTADADEMAEVARSGGRILAVNLIMRYNPLCQAVKRLVDLRLLGEPLYATLINIAQDELLGPGHWFWDRSLSGGIFIEHGVHFFDLFEWWFGPGDVVTAYQVPRPGSGIIDQVSCTVRHGGSSFAHFYHGFHQMLRRDQQHWTLVFELGTLTMTEWVPTALTLDATVDDASAAALGALFPGCSVGTVERYTGKNRLATSRHLSREVDQRIRLTATAGRPKMELYGEMVRDLLADQIASIGDPQHRRLIDERNGISSLRSAVTAQKLADDNRSTVPA